MPIFMKVETLGGGPGATGPGGEIEVSTVSYGASVPITSPVGGGRTEVGRPSVADVAVTKLHDAASLSLMDALLNGRPLGTVRIRFASQAGDKSDDYLLVELVDAFVSSMSAASGGGQPEESVTFHCERIRWTDTSTDEGQTVEHDMTQ